MRSAALLVRVKVYLSSLNGDSPQDSVA